MGRVFLEGLTVGVVLVGQVGGLELGETGMKGGLTRSMVADGLLVGVGEGDGQLVSLTRRRFMKLDWLWWEMAAWVTKGRGRCLALDA